MNPLSLINPLSSDFIWWQVGRKAGSLVSKGATATLAPAIAPDWFFWATTAAVVAGGAVLVKRMKKGRR